VIDVGRGFGPAADSLSLLVQRKEAKKAPGEMQRAVAAAVIDRCAPGFIMRLLAQQALDIRP